MKFIAAGPERALSRLSSRKELINVDFRHLKHISLGNNKFLSLEIFNLSK